MGGAYMYSYYYIEDLITSWGILFVLSLIGGTIAYFLFVRSDKEPNNSFLIKLKSFLNFKSLMIEDLFKLTYVILAIFTTLFSFSLISTSFLLFIIYLILGNIVVRIIYEKLMLVLMIWKNTNEIKKNTAKEEAEQINEENDKVS